MEMIFTHKSGRQKERLHRLNSQKGAMMEYNEAPNILDSLSHFTCVSFTSLIYENSKYISFIYTKLKSANNCTLAAVLFYYAT